MIFIANVLTMNGGTTFLIRICREFHRRGTSVAVLVLFPLGDSTLRAELCQYAKVFDLSDFLWDRGRVFRMQLMTFAPVRWSHLFSELIPYGKTVHVMGVFGLIFACRAAYKEPLLCITAGVYHQNEFLFKTDDNSFFVKAIYKMFRSLTAKQVLFFNSVNAENYGKFFARDYSESIISPIGIDIPERGVELLWTPKSELLISIGNLVNFKTYNRHIIEIVKKLSSKHANLQYHIYGTGPEEKALKNLVKNLNLKDKVHFKGILPYSDFASTVLNASVFIGSGTALLEAALLGVPALVGIESIQEPETYGFLSDVNGFSYNEYMPNIPRVPMLELIDNLLCNDDLKIKISSACRIKAETFSVKFSANAFERLKRNELQPITVLHPVSNFKIFLSFAGVVILDLIGLSSVFRNRRNQSFE